MMKINLERAKDIVSYKEWYDRFDTVIFYEKIKILGIKLPIRRPEMYRITNIYDGSAHLSGNSSRSKILYGNTVTDVEETLKKTTAIYNNVKTLEEGKEITNTKPPPQSPRPIVEPAPQSIRPILCGRAPSSAPQSIIGRTKQKPQEKPIMAHIFCWDGVEYDRETTKEEIDKNSELGYVKYTGEFGCTFDFRK